jgi:hypothetical protein
MGGLGGSAAGAAGASGSGGVAGASATGGAAGGSGVGGRGGAAGSAGAGGTTETCGFVMPNPVSSGLPNPASYDTSVAGIVTDRVTGLSWERQLTGHAAIEGCTVNITGLLYCPLRYAAAYCAANRLGGYADWRLPTVAELISLTDFMQWYPSIDAAAFPDTPYEAFWSSTRAGGGRLDYAWMVWFTTGGAGTSFIDEAAHVRCVRQGGAPPARCVTPGARFQLAGDQVSDALTGLTWQRGGSPGTSFAGAATYCSSLGGGFRVPSIKELTTLIDYPRIVASGGGSTLDPIFERPQDISWSSSVALGEFMSAWALDLRDSYGTRFAAGINFSVAMVKCVR